MYKDFSRMMYQDFLNLNIVHRYLYLSKRYKFWYIIYNYKNFKILTYTITVLSHLTKVNGPPNDTSFDFHKASLFVIFSIVSFQCSNFFIEVPTGRPRYVNGNNPYRHPTLLAQLLISSFGMPKPNIFALTDIYF